MGLSENRVPQNPRLYHNFQYPIIQVLKTKIDITWGITMFTSKMTSDRLTTSHQQFQVVSPPKTTSFYSLAIHHLWKTWENLGNPPSFFSVHHLTTGHFPWPCWIAKHYPFQPPNRSKLAGNVLVFAFCVAIHHDSSFGYG